jgi:hypothetical protein
MALIRSALAFIGRLRLRLTPCFAKPAMAAARTPRRHESGVSLLEVLLAAVMFLAIALATVPMFTRSMVSNSSGNDSTRAANYARGRVEEFRQLPFNHMDLTIEAGTEKVFEEYHAMETDTWEDGVAPDGVAVDWLRTSRVRQYNVDVLSDETIDTAEALPAGTDSSFVHLKEIEVRVAQLGGLFNNETKAITLRTVRSQ